MAKEAQAIIATKYQVINERRCVVVSGRDQFSLHDTHMAVPFALLKFLAGSLAVAEGKHELSRQGSPVALDDPKIV